MRKLAALALIAILGGAWYIIHDVGHVPIFDANLQRLAESSAEAYCAGTTFWETGGGGSDDKGRAAAAAIARSCRAESGRSSEPDLQAVVPSFCQAVKDSGYDGTLAECQAILEGRKLWPTYNGSLTDSWSEASPYPGDKVFVVPQGDSRTGERDGFSRDDEPTTTTAEETTTTEGEG